MPLPLPPMHGAAFRSTREHGGRIYTHRHRRRRAPGPAEAAPAHEVRPAIPGTGMLHSGIDPIDGVIGGLAAGRVHVLTGAPGTGKTAACLQFAYAGLRRGEPALALCTQPAGDLRSLAAHLGLDLRVPLREERLVLLRYGAAVTAGGGNAGTRLLDELRASIAALSPTRVVVDSLMPFLAADGASGATLAGLAALLDDVGATTLVTVPGDLVRDYDRRLESLLQRAAAILHFVPDGGRVTRVDVVRGPAVDDETPRRFAVRAGGGIVPAPVRAPDVAQEATPAVAARARTGRLLLLHEGDAPAPESMAILGRAHVVRPLAAGGARPAVVAREPVDAIVVEANHRTLDAALARVHDLARQDVTAPIVTFSRFTLRSADRARALRAGADDTLTGDMGAAELGHRLALVVARGRVASASHPSWDASPARQPLDEFGFPRVLDEDELAAALAGAGDEGDEGAMLDLTVDAADLDELARLALRSLRLAGGDLAARTAGAVVVYLRDARRRDTNSFVDRIRGEWSRQGRSALRVVVRQPGRRAPVRPSVAGAVGG